MASSSILGFFLLAAQIFNIYCQKDITPPPKVEGSYRAMGELSEEIPDAPGFIIQVAFEENYDEKLNKSAYTIWELGQNFTFIENYAINQVLRYDNNIACSVVTPEEWIEFDAPPSFLGYLQGTGEIRFNLQNLFALDKSNLKRYMDVWYRDISAKLWMYEMRGKKDGFNVTVIVYAYWSDPKWNSTSTESIPLGYHITTLIYNETHLDTKFQMVNVFSFVHGAVNKAAFEPKEGIYCSGDVRSQFLFPTLPKLDALSLHSEVALEDYQEVKTIDIYYDMKNKLLRVDFDRILRQQPLFLKQGRRITWEITSASLEAAFEMDILKDKLTCTVTQLKDFEFEVQDIIDPTLKPAIWDVYHLFGVNTTTYRYIGKTSKRNIPCHMFQGIREDWPKLSSPATSLWEWCLAVKITKDDDVVDFRDGELPWVSLQIHIIKSDDQNFPKGFRLMHHFYDALSEDPANMYPTAFDHVSRCFNETDKRRLQFTLNVTVDSENLMTLENATSDSKFLDQWRLELLRPLKLEVGALRIVQLRSTIYNDEMYVMFTLLGEHPDLPIKGSSKSLETAEEDIRSTVDDGSLLIKYIYQPGKSLTLSAKPETLVVQVDPRLRVDTNSTVRPTTTTVTTVNPIVDDAKKKDSGSSTGVVVGVAIAMLVVGATAGACGTYFKFKGLPQVLRRA